MQRNTLWKMLLATAAVFTLPAQAGQPVADEVDPEQMLAHMQAQNDARLKQAHILAARGQPRDLLAAALLVPMQYDMAQKTLERDAMAMAWQARAFQIGSDDPLIAAAAVRHCIAGNACGIDKAVATLQRTGDDEAGAQLLLMKLARHRKDAAAEAQAWQKAVAATHYDDELAGTMALLDHATREMPVVASSGPAQGAATGSAAEGERIILVFSIAAANWQPQLKLLQDNCSEDALQQAVRRDECRRLFHTLAGSPSLLMAQWGSSWLAGNGEVTEQATWRERRRELAWVLERYAEASNAELKASAPMVGFGQYARWIAADGELPAMLRLLDAHGIARQPPPGWQPAALPPAGEATTPL